MKASSITEYALGLGFGAIIMAVLGGAALVIGAGWWRLAAGIMGG